MKSQKRNRSREETDEMWMRSFFSNFFDKVSKHGVLLSFRSSDDFKKSKKIKKADPNSS